MYDNILIPTDGSDHLPETLEPGIELASQHGATVHVLHVIENHMLRTALAPRSMRSIATETQSAGETAVAAVSDCAEEHGVETVTWVLRGRPTLLYGSAHETIVEYAETNDVDLIVMGSSDRGWLSMLFSPSVTQRVMAATDIPVYGRRVIDDARMPVERSSRTGRGAEASD